MTKPIEAAEPANAGVWIDHRRAQIVALTATGDSTTVILSTVDKHPERGGDRPMQGRYEAVQVPADDRRQGALTAALDSYYDAVIAALRNYGSVFVFGPGEAKGELRARFAKLHLDARIAAVATEDKMTDRQIVAKVRAYFGVAAPRQQNPQ
jgi:hypothetical protein